MHLRYRNVNTAFRGVLELWETLPRIHEESRVGIVERIAEPVLLTYIMPTERVLFNPARDANPFFHLYEALWMLAGCNDVRSLAYFNSQMEQYSDDGETFNGAYGYRWRSKDYWDPNQPTPGKPWLKLNQVDQLDVLVNHLKQTPNSRRAVLQMWNVEDDLLKIDTSKDCCCNTHVYFSLDTGELDMTVCNRSNDLVWGMLGANVVHFSFLQEYMAARIGVHVGVYNHFTNNLHAYVERFNPQAWLEDTSYLQQDYDRKSHSIVPLVSNPKQFEYELKKFVAWPLDPERRWKEPFFQNVASPMCRAFSYHTIRGYAEALKLMRQVVASDWRWAGEQWLVKRRDLWQQKSTNQS